MTAETKRSVWLALGQVALVVLSVGLGLAVGEWRQSRADAARAAQAVDGAVREIARNREQVARAIDYHDELLGAIEGGATSLNLRPAFVTDNAWETAQAAGVVPDLPFAVVEALSEIHDVQQTYGELAKVTVSLLYLSSVFQGDALGVDARGYAGNVSDLQFFERRLVGLYDDALVSIADAGYAVADSLLAAP